MSEITYTPRDWRNGPKGGTRLNDVGLEDMELRLAAYTDAKAHEVDLRVTTLDARMDVMEVTGWNTITLEPGWTAEPEALWRQEGTDVIRVAGTIGGGGGDLIAGVGENPGLSSGTPSRSPTIYSGGYGNLVLGPDGLSLEEMVGGAGTVYLDNATFRMTPVEPPPDTGGFDLVGDWQIRADNVQDNPFFIGSFCFDNAAPALATTMWVHKQDAIMNDDHSAELLSAHSGDEIRIVYPATELGSTPPPDIDTDGATFDLTADPVDGGLYVVFAVANTEVHGSLASHYGEDTLIYMKLIT